MYLYKMWLSWFSGKNKKAKVKRVKKERNGLLSSAKHPFENSRSIFFLLFYFIVVVVAIFITFFWRKWKDVKQPVYTRYIHTYIFSPTASVNVLFCLWYFCSHCFLLFLLGICFPLLWNHHDEILPEKNQLCRNMHVVRAWFLLLECFFFILFVSRSEPISSRDRKCQSKWLVVFSRFASKREF